jgi:RNA polymerase sigma-70 factor, ECF subfamily
MLLECLSPTERAVFLLREVFDYKYEEIGMTIGKSIPNCRQIVRRARQHLILRRPAINSTSHDKHILIEQFLDCWNQADLQALIALMAEDITFWSDGGGKVIAAKKPLYGCTKVARFLIAIRRSRLTPTLVSQVIVVNDQLGVMNTMDEKLHSTFSFEFADNRIRSIFAVVNPDKLKSVKKTIFC